MKTREAIAILEEQGFEFKGQKGSHAKYAQPGRNAVIVPMHARDIAMPTLKKIWEQAGLSALKNIKSMTEYREILASSPRLTL